MYGTSKKRLPEPLLAKLHPSNMVNTISTHFFAIHKLCKNQSLKTFFACGFPCKHCNLCRRAFPTRQEGVTNRRIRPIAQITGCRVFFFCHLQRELYLSCAFLFLVLELRYISTIEAAHELSKSQQGILAFFGEFVIS